MTDQAGATKRPLGIYFIAFWWFFVFGRSVTWVAEFASTSAESAGWIGALALVLTMALMIFFIWELVALIQMRMVAYWILVVILSLSTISILINAPGVLAETSIPWRMGILFFVFLAINLTIIWLTTRRSFRERCREMTTEREAKARRNLIDKQLRKSF